MRNTASLHRWDAAVTAYLSSRRALGRLFHKEEVALRHIRAYMQRHQATDLTEGVFDSWRQQSCQLSASTRVIRERTVYNFCRYRRRAERHCFCPDPFSLTRPRPHPLPVLIEHVQVRRLLKHLQQCASMRSRRRAVLRILRRYVRKAARTVPSLRGKKLHPHSIRHSTAIALLKAGVDFATISQWLGHAGLNTTMRYARVDLDLKRQALAQVFPTSIAPPRGGRLLIDGSDVIGWLRRM